MEKYNKLVEKYLNRAREKWPDFDEKLEKIMAESACPEENYTPSGLEDIAGYLGVTGLIDNHLKLFNVIMVVSDCDEDITIEKKCKILESCYDEVF